MRETMNLKLMIFTHQPYHICQLIALHFSSVFLLLKPKSSHDPPRNLAQASQTLRQGNRKHHLLGLLFVQGTGWWAMFIVYYEKVVGKGRNSKGKGRNCWGTKLPDFFWAKLGWFFGTLVTSETLPNMMKEDNDLPNQLEIVTFTS